MTIKLLLSLSEQKSKHKKSNDYTDPTPQNIDIKIESYLRSIDKIKDISVGNMLDELDMYIFSLFKHEVVFSKPIIKMLLRVLQSLGDRR
jgi:hypothetical protein